MALTNSSHGKRRMSVLNEEPAKLNMDLQLKIMRLIGLWQDDKLGSGIISKIYPFYKASILSCVIIHLVTMAVGLGHYWGDFGNLAMILSMVLSYIEVSFKIVDTYYFRDKIEHLIKTVVEDFSRVPILYGPAQNEIVKDCMSLAKKLCNIYIMLAIMAGGTWCVEPILDKVMHALLHPHVEHEWALPFMAWYPFDQHSTPFFQFVYLFQAAAAIIGTVVTVASDMCFVSLMIFTAGHLRMLGKSVENLRIGRHGNKQLAQYGSDFREIPLEQQTELTQKMVLAQEEESYNFLVACIQHHKSIMSFAKELERIISPVMFFQFLATTLEICLAGFQAKLGNNVGPSFFKFLLYTSANICQTFCYCKFGDNIVIASNVLSSSTYNGEWYEGSERFKKCLRILMLRSQKPIILWAAKFYAVSLETFSNLMHHSYSFFTLLSQMHE